ncbi:MAG TPA: cyanase [Mycolicibacillus parakoreensis]|nr:cyanase [Mycolicibacillus parakoreensis]
MLEAMNRNDITEQVVVARLQKGLSWQDLAEAIDRPVVWTTSALLGQHPLPVRAAEIVVDKLGLDAAAVPVLAAVPLRGALSSPVPTDPTIYRFYEAVQVYGPAIKELIHEQFGDGIMSAINMSVDVQKKPHPAGERVVVTFDGKFLPYEWVRADGDDRGD